MRGRLFGLRERRIYGRGELQCDLGGTESNVLAGRGDELGLFHDEGFDDQRGE